MRFEPFLRLDLRHEYHGEAPAPIALEPDAATRRLAARPDLRLRLADGIAEAFASEDRTALGALAEDDSLVLTFRLRPREASLAAMTAAVAQVRDAVPVLELGTDRPMATVGAADLRPLVASEIIAPADLACPPLAIVRLTVAPETRDADFLVRFEAVARFWTYHVIGGAADVDYAVRDRDSALSFEPLGPRLMSNGARAQSFRSSAPIAERARPAGRFELVSEGPFGPRVVMATLPCPRPGPGTLDPHGAAASEIFVNLC